MTTPQPINAFIYWISRFFLLWCKLFTNSNIVHWNIEGNEQMIVSICTIFFNNWDVVINSIQNISLTFYLQILQKVSNTTKKNKQNLFFVIWIYIILLAPADTKYRSRYTYALRLCLALCYTALLKEWASHTLAECITMDMFPY